LDSSVDTADVADMADTTDTAEDTVVLDTTVVDTALDVTTVPVDGLADGPAPEATALDAFDDGGGPLGCGSTGAPSAEGTLAFDAALDFQALCGGVVLLGDRAANRIARIQLPAGTVTATYGLTASPQSLALDGSRSLLYASLFPATKLARVNLATGVVTYVPLSIAVKNIALGPDGQVLGLAIADGTTRVVVIDGLNAKELGIKMPPAFTNAGLLAFVPATSTLFLADVGSSPSRFGRYAFGSSSTLTLVQDSFACYNGRELALSPDGTRLAIACGGGNGTGYSIYDFAAADLTSWAGEWTTGAYPTAAAFSPDGTRFGSSDTKVLQLFDAKSHALLKSSSVSVCSSSFEHVRFSPDGKLLIGMTDCLSASGGKQLAWVPVP
ncbi:MAG: WD40 repeat domain-containing protein, partial [Polyangiales bacterium]